MVDPKLARAYGTLAGFGFIGVAVLTLPSTRLLDPPPAPEAYFLTLLAMVTGLICMAIPWERFDPRWLHLIGIVATVEAAATVEVFGQPYVAFFFLIAVLVAYVAPEARTLGLQLGLICVAMFGPVLYGSADARSSLNVALVAAPILLLTASLFSYLRMKMVHDRRAYHRFAQQTLVLSSQIAGRQLAPVTPPRQVEPVPSLSTVRPPAAAIAAVAALLGIPLFAGGLAAAGVKLPDLANEPFERVGIELPNQEADNAAPPPTTGKNKGVNRGEVVGGRERQVATTEAGSRHIERATPAGKHTDPAPPPPGIEPAVPADSVAPQSHGGPDPPAPQPSAPSDDGQLKSPLTDLLDQATDNLQDLLDKIQGGGQG